MTIDEFKEHVAGRALEPGKRPVIDWCGSLWQVVGAPAAAWARDRFVQIRPLDCYHDRRDKLMPVRVAHPLLPAGFEVADVS